MGRLKYRLLRIYAWLWFQWRDLLHPRSWGNPWYWAYKGLAGRREDPTPLICECGWVGMRRQAVHGYAACGNDEVEPMDYCPECECEI